MATMEHPYDDENLQAGNASNLFKSWWQWALIGIVIASALIGTGFVIFRLIRKWRATWKISTKPSSLRHSSIRAIDSITSSYSPNQTSDEKRSKYQSFGVYYGSFESPPSPDQLRMLSRWELLVVDPFAKGATSALCATVQRGSRVLISIDVADERRPSAKTKELVVELFQRVIGILQPLGPTGPQNPASVSGIVLRKWTNVLSRGSLHQVTARLQSLGLEIFLDCSETLEDHRILESDSISGVVICNAAVLASGEPRDAFQMMENKSIIKAFISEACQRNFTVLVLDAYDDSASMSNAVLRRAANWSKFVNALLWAGPRQALYSATHIQKEPLGAFDWLKEQQVMDVHEKWRGSTKLVATPSTISQDLCKLENIFPSIDQLDFSAVKLSTGNAATTDLIVSERFPFSAPADTERTASCPGCSPLGQLASKKAFSNVVAVQQQLQEKDLLEDVDVIALQAIGQTLHEFVTYIRRHQHRNTPWEAAIKNLASNLCDLQIMDPQSPIDNSKIRVFVGLDSGFRTTDGRFWAVFAKGGSALDIYVSRNSVKHMTGVVLHAYLSSQKFSDEQCFQAEFLMNKWANPRSVLPARIAEDISLLSPSESLNLLRELSTGSKFNDSLLVKALMEACESELLDGPDHLERLRMATAEYTGGAVTVAELIETRLSWHRSFSGSQTLQLEDCIQVFEEIHSRLFHILANRNEDDLAQVTSSIQAILQDGGLCAPADMFLLAVFTFFYKEALNEVYLEVCDRNPLFNDQSDQAAAFAELFATGSRCESYFGMTPSSLGRVLSDRYRRLNRGASEPPIWTDDAPPVESAYAAAQIDIDPDSKSSKISSFQAFGFMSVFALPALIDIMLLSSIKRGLYLSASMTAVELQSITLALMMSLLLSGAIGSWITAGGSYYLISMAFSAMNMFVFTRLIGGFAFTLLVALIGFMGVGIHDGISAGLIFFLYLIALTAYLCLLATLANFQYPGSSFLSGRPLILMIIPFLLISPLVTRYVRNHDTTIYLCVLYAFVAILAGLVKWTSGRWASWFLSIPMLTDVQITDWYIETKAENDKNAFDGFSYPKAVKISREALLKDVRVEMSASILSRHKSTKDVFVAKLASSYRANMFLLEWYCGQSASKIPLPYSSTFNVQTKIALKTIIQLQQGIRLHNSFLHWRIAGDEIGCSVLYFVVALIDKWISLFANDPGAGFLTGSTALTSRELDVTKAIGLSLAYYLVGAVLLDMNSQALNKMTGQGQNVAIKTLEEVSSAVNGVTSLRRKLYWRMLGRYLTFHVWSMASSAGLLWVFGGVDNITVIYLAYVAAYTGLLWFQYTKIFSGPKTLKPLLAAACLGFLVGFLLRHFVPNFSYNNVIALGVACWSAAILSLYSAGIHSRTTKPYRPIEGSYHTYGFGPDKSWSQMELRIAYEKMDSVSESDKYRINPTTSPSGLEIRAYLSHCLQALKRRSPSGRSFKAFPNAARLIERTIMAFDASSIVVDCVSATPTSIDGSISGLSHWTQGDLHVLLRCDTTKNLRTPEEKSNFNKFVAGVLLHLTAEHTSGFSCRDAFLLETLLTDVDSDEGSVPFGVAYVMSTSECEGLHQHFEREHFELLCLGVKADTAWDSCSRSLRNLIIKRACGAVDTTPTHRHSIPDNASCDFVNFAQLIDRCDYGLTVMRACQDFVAPRQPKFLDDSSSSNSLYELKEALANAPEPEGAWSRYFGLITSPLVSTYHLFGTALKISLIGFVADPELPRELDYILHKKPVWFRNTIMAISMTTWIYARTFQRVFVPLLLIRGRKAIMHTWKHIGGSKIVISNGVVKVDGLEGPYTGFIHSESKEASFLHLYNGNHQQEPDSAFKGEKITNTYTKDLRLTRREESKGSQTSRVYVYEYVDPETANNHRLSRVNNKRYPIYRKCIEGDSTSQTVYFNARGLVDSGSYVRDGNFIRFRCHYRAKSTFDDDLLRAEFALPHMTVTVSWSVPSEQTPELLDTWIPHSQVTEATFVIGSDVYECVWRYDHKFEPQIITTVNGFDMATPALIQHDHLGILKKPTKFSFLDDDPLISFRNIDSKWRRQKRYNPVSTSRARSRLWKAWRNTAGFDAVTARWMDERLLRRDTSLKPYWHLRDQGHLQAARQYLDSHSDTIVASIDLDNAISGFAPLAIRMPDLVSFGGGGDANARSRSNDNQNFDGDELQVLAADTGTWPNEGGGVSACRRDLVNNLKNCKWHILAESANDFGLPKHQTEENVRTLKVIPLWGLDFLTPTHGLFHNRLDSEIEHIPGRATKNDMELNFVPILATLVRGSRAVEFTSADIIQMTRALVDLNTYFQGSKHWGSVWTNKTVKSAWRALWTAPDLVAPSRSDTWFQTEIPTIAQMDLALELWFRYLFIFSIPLPEKLPPVFQASHHSVSAAYGVVCKIKRNCTLQIWDHAISWRETNLYLSSALCNLPPFTRNALLGLIKITSVVVLHHADNILPCADFFNPNWEIEIGTCQGKIESRKTFQRKIDPVVNGITDWNAFKPVEEIKSKTPTVVMLSHVWYAKDIKTAILSADIIVNDWGFKDYQLDIYGALDKAPTYSTDCQEIIASKGLQRQVCLKGESNPVSVLEKAWLFVNSSVSEGLPLALGEAALTGAPIVCTDVGATLRILTDPDDGSCYSSIVAPNDARALARAQIKLLGMTDEWSKFANDDAAEPLPRLPERPTPEDVDMITARMYSKKEERRLLGMRSRDIIQKSFAGERYLREHEQMLWIGKSAKNMRKSQLIPTALISDQEAVLESQYDIPLDNFNNLNTERNIALAASIRQSRRTEQSVPSQLPSVFSNLRDTDTASITPVSTIYHAGTAERERYTRLVPQNVNIGELISAKLEPPRTSNQFARYSHSSHGSRQSSPSGTHRSSLAY